MTSAIDKRSALNLNGVHVDLVAVVKRASEITDIKFMVIEGLRTLERQKELVQNGASRTLNSRHLTGHAVDIVPVDVNGDPMWDWPVYYRLAKIIKSAAMELGVPIEWGGDWKSFKDGPHWQLPWKQYPAPQNIHLGEKTSYTSEQDLHKSRTVAGGSIAAIGGIATIADSLTQASDAAEKANNYFMSGSTLSLIIGVMIIAGALLAIYARWDDAGKPLPWGKK